MRPFQLVSAVITCGFMPENYSTVAMRLQKCYICCMSYPQANQELTVGAMKEMCEHIEKQARFPFHKKMSSMEGALRYTRLALETYCNAKATIEPIDEGFWKFLITVSCVEEPKKEDENG